MDLERLVEDGEVIFLAYLGFITQPLVTSIIEALEKLDEEDENVNFPHKLYVIFIEMAQNIMHYSTKGKYRAFILIGKEGEDYYILSKNLTTEKGKDRIEKSLHEIEGLDRKALRQLYKERRKSGKDSHDKGAGIGFLEIAKVAKKIDFEFEKYDKEGEDNYIFALKAYI